MRHRQHLKICDTSTKDLVNAIRTVVLCCVFTSSLSMACDFKPAMTDAEIAACRKDAAQSSQPARTHQAPRATQAPLQPQPPPTADDVYRQQVRQQQLDAERERRETAEASLPKDPFIGMTKAEFLPLQKRTPSYCPYPKINTTTNASGVHEQWVCISGTLYLYFDNDVLTSIHEGH
jgi:hypothetical protein